MYHTPTNCDVEQAQISLDGVKWNGYFLVIFINSVCPENHQFSVDACLWTVGHYLWTNCV